MDGSLASPHKRDLSPPAEAGPSSRPHKVARTAAPADADAPLSAAASKMAAAALAHALADGTECAPAWSRSNLIALPSPPPPYSPFLSSDAPPSLAITLTHLSGAPASAAKGKSTARLSFTITLPRSSRPSRISRLSFSPCGSYLLAVRSTVGDRGDSMIVFEQQDGCINEWDKVWDERVAGFGEAEGKDDGKRVVELRWLGEERKWYPAPVVPEEGDYERLKRPLFCAPARSPAVLGAAFVAILSSSELLFVHLPRLSPLVPLTTLLPLSSHLSLTALPTATTSTAGPQNSIDDLVANLVDGMPDNGPSPSVIVGALGLVQGDAAAPGGGRGMGAMREELRAAEERKGRGDAEKRAVRIAAVGAARVRASAADAGTTRLLIATVSAPTSLTPPAASLPAAAHQDPIEPLASSPHSTTNEFSMSDFGLLDEAFGDAPVPPPPAPVVRKRRTGDRAEDVVELREVKIDMLAPDGPRISLRQLSPLHIPDPSSRPTAPGLLTHLAWLEDIDLPPPTIPFPKVPDYTSTKLAPDVAKLELAKHEADLAGARILLSVKEAKEAGVDLRLVAVVATKPAKAGKQTSALTTWAFSNPLYPLSDAFVGLECKKADVLSGPREWLARRAAARTVDGLVGFVLPRQGHAFSSFVVGVARKDDEGLERTFVSSLDSSTLEQRAQEGETKLPGHAYYSTACISPSRSVLCATPYAQLTPRPVMAAVPIASESSALPNALGLDLAIAISRQVDTSDLVGRVVGLKDDTSSIAIVRIVRDTLQAMLRPGTALTDTPLELERLGVVASVYKASTNLSLRGSIAYDITQLAACVRAFAKCEKKNRGAVGLGYECESDAIWPLIGHLTWFCDFCRELVQEINGVQSLNPGNEPNPRLLLILHPLPRGLLLRATEYILGLQAFLGVFPPGSNVTVDVSRSVLDDVVEYNGLVLREWGAMLTRVGALDGLVGPSPELVDMLVEFLVPAALSNATTMATAILSLPSLFLATPPTPPTTPSATLPPLDLVRKGRLPATGAFKECTKCGERTEKREISVVEGGKWAGVEMAWEGRCTCGGMWVGKTV